MNRRIKSGMGALVVALAMMLGALGQVHPAAAAQTMGPLDVIKALAAAQNANDPAAMRALISPDAQFVQDPGAPGPRTQSREEFISGNTGANNTHVVLSNLALTAPDTVTGDVMLSGGGIPKLPHPFTISVTFKVSGGLVTSGVFLVSAQTKQDIAAMGPPPGMPSTGAPDGLLPWLLAAGLLLLAVGALVRRVSPAKR